MSSILEALQKSERARAQQRQQPPFALHRPDAGFDFPALPCPTPASALPSAPWLLLGLFIGIVLVLLAVIALLLWQKPPSPPVPAPPAVVMVPPALWANPPTAATGAPATTTNQGSPDAGEATAFVAPTFPAFPTARESAFLPENSKALPADFLAPPTPLLPVESGNILDLGEVPWEVRRQLPPLELDIHAYNPNPEKRFVFINLVRYTQGDLLKPELLLQEITQDGVILRFQDLSFRLLLQE